MLEYHEFVGLGYLYAALVVVFATCLTAAVAITLSDRRSKP